uniref:Uncharacterized protein n=1 Tax=Lates calcarifer TaxID=8187 RepID=A0A4W6BJG5_LATCA
MASVAPFGRRQWASQSLRVTAKELSIVSARGKNTAIAERFSKYQMAAEEGSAEKKKATGGGLVTSCCSDHFSRLAHLGQLVAFPAGQQLNTHSRT